MTEKAFRLLGDFVIIALYFGIGFLIGRNTRRIGPEPIEIVKVDTVIIYDTIVRERPVSRVSYIERWDTVEVATIRHDTVLVELPIERKVYHEDSLYYASVSGIRPSLDTLIVWPKTTTITIDRTKTIPAPKWSVGVTAGPSALVTPGGRIYGGLGASVGVTYRF